MSGGSALGPADLLVSQELGQSLPTIPADVLTEIERLVGVTVLRGHRLDGGASRSGWQIELSKPVNGSRIAYLRLGATATGAVARTYNVVREAQIVRDLGAVGVPVPGVIAIGADLPLALMDFVPGQSDFSRVNASASRRNLAHQYLHALDTVHRLDASTIWTFDADRSATIADATAVDLVEWSRFSTADGLDVDPLLAMTQQWLDRNIVTNPAPPCLVHGDAGPGNFMFRNRRLTAIVDWELAHIGDPIEDLGWILLRAAEVPFTELAWWLGEFARYNHLTVGVESVRFHRILALYKTTVALTSSLASGAPGRSGQLLPLLALYRTYLCRLLAEALDVPPTELPPMPPAVTVNPALNHVPGVAVEAADLLQEALASGSMDAATKVAIRRSRIILGYLARREGVWPDAVEALCQSATGILGSTPDGIDALQTELAPYADLDRPADSVRALKVLTDLEQQRLSLWPGLPRRANAGFHSTNDLISGSQS